MSIPSKARSETFTVAINYDYGGFRLSDVAHELLKSKAMEYYKISKEEVDNKYNYPFTMKRDDPLLIEVIEILGKDANSKNSSIRLIQVPIIFKNDYKITDYDGAESILYDISTVITKRIVAFNPETEERDCKDFIMEMKALYEKYKKY